MAVKIPLPKPKIKLPNPPGKSPPKQAPEPASGRRGEPRKGGPAAPAAQDEDEDEDKEAAEKKLLRYRDAADIVWEILVGGSRPESPGVGTVARSFISFARSIVTDNFLPHELADTILTGLREVLLFQGKKRFREKLADKQPPTERALMPARRWTWRRAPDDDRAAPITARAIPSTKPTAPAKKKKYSSDKLVADMKATVRKKLRR